MNMEQNCEKCGSDNIVWFVNSVLWNKYAGNSSILCITCFVQFAEAQGFLPTAWELVPENPPKSKEE